MQVNLPESVPRSVVTVQENASQQLCSQHDVCRDFEQQGLLINARGIKIF